jgi:transposase-like protein
MRRKSRAEWAAIVTEFLRSGESVAKFTRRLGLRPSSLKWWCWRLRDAAPAEPREEVRLVPVDVVGLGARRAGEIVVAIGDVEVRAEIGTDVTYVGALVRELRSRC